MNYRAENRTQFIAAKLLGYREVASCGVDVYERARARKNLRRLVHDHPGIALELGMTLARHIPSVRTEDGHKSVATDLGLAWRE